MPRQKYGWYYGCKSGRGCNLGLRGNAAVVPAPEPTTATLSLLALAVLAARRRRG
ncbi:MAG: PEP-CTERM sorting domain-containing protein [Akkermansia sp.]|nr:PEP-CTERM sorting domain-containing protein [Akkermansia sp.]